MCIIYHALKNCLLDIFHVAGALCPILADARGAKYYCRRSDGNKTRRDGERRLESEGIYFEKGEESVFSYWINIDDN